jgi:hypothetical protein
MGGSHPEIKKLGPKNAFRSRNFRKISKTYPKKKILGINFKNLKNRHFHPRFGVCFIGVPR